jgi:hypothetical protein
MVKNMAVATGKRPKAAVVKQEAIDNTSAFLQSLPDKPKEDMSLREAIEQMREPLRAALLKGYTYQELAAMLSDQGIKISAFTLKNYVPSGRRRAKEQAAAAKATTGRGRKKTLAADLADQIASLPSGTANQPSEEEEVATPETDAPKKTTRGGRATAAKAQSDSGSTVKQATPKRTPSRATAKSVSTKAPTSKARKKSAS